MLFRGKIGFTLRLGSSICSLFLFDRSTLFLLLDSLARGGIIVDIVIPAVTQLILCVLGGALLGSLLGRSAGGSFSSSSPGLPGTERRRGGGGGQGRMTSFEFLHDGFGKVLAVFWGVSSVLTCNGLVFEEKMRFRECRDVRHCVLGKRITKTIHDLLDARPISTALALIVAVNHGDAEVALGGIVPLLVLGGHDDDDDEMNDCMVKSENVLKMTDCLFVLLWMRRYRIEKSK